MRVEVDQSGKVEDTAKATVVAFSNSMNYAIKVKSTTKQHLQAVFRQLGKAHLFVYRVFAALVFLLIHKHLDKITHLVIDIEYHGKEKLIKDILLEFLRKNKLKEPEISFKRIGSKPKVHYAAYDVFTGEIKENKLISFRQLANLVIKKDRGRDD